MQHESTYHERGWNAAVDDLQVSTSQDLVARTDEKQYDLDAREEQLDEAEGLLREFEDAIALDRVTLDKLRALLADWRTLDSTEIAAGEEF